MIATSEQPEVKQTTPPSFYKVAVPATNPLMPSAAVSLVPTLFDRFFYSPVRSKLSLFSA